MAGQGDVAAHNATDSPNASPSGARKSRWSIALPSFPERSSRTSVTSEPAADSLPSERRISTRVEREREQQEIEGQHEEMVARRRIMHVLRDARQSATIDWTIKETVRAEMRAMVKRLLRKYKYPPDQQEAATDLVLLQAETLAADFTR